MWQAGLLAELKSTVQMRQPTTLLNEWVEIFISSVLYGLLYRFHKVSELIGFWKNENHLLKTALCLQSQHNLVLPNVWILHSEVVLIALQAKVISFLFMFCVPFLTNQKFTVTSGRIMTGMVSSYVFTTPDALRPEDLPAVEVFVENQVVSDRAVTCYKVQTGKADGPFFFIL